jgi:hypothetical protein
VSAHRCVLGTVVEPNDGEWQVRDEQEATGGFDGLVAALRQPSATRTDDACPLIAVAPVELTLTDAHRRTLSPAVPQDACGLPQASVQEAADALSWKLVKQTKVRRLRGQLELDSGCPGRYKPMMALQAATGAGKTGSSGHLFGGMAPASLTVCRYRLDPADTISIAGGSESYANGVLDTATTLTDSRASGLATALGEAPAATAHCARPQAPFAVGFPAAHPASAVVIELGGCYRAVDSDGHLRQLDAHTVGLLTS